MERLYNKQDLSARDRVDFVNKFKKDQAAVPMTLDPEIFLEVWLENKNKPKDVKAAPQSKGVSNEDLARDD